MYVYIYIFKYHTLNGLWDQSPQMFASATFWAAIRAAATEDDFKGRGGKTFYGLLTLFWKGFCPEFWTSPSTKTS